MSEQYPKIQFSSLVNGDQLVLRADDGAELAKVAKGLAENSGEIVEDFTTVKQVMLAKGVFTGNASEGKTDAKPVATSQTAPTCEHGTYNDTAGKKTKAGGDYKFRYYCPKWGSDCKPSN